MGLIINQGKQDTSQDNKFAPIEDKNVLASITKIALNKYAESTLDVHMQILGGVHKNRIVIDRVSFDPKSQFSWKYRALRKSANVPYSEDESATIDIEALLVGRVVTLDLGITETEDKTGEKKQYQKVTYKKTELTTDKKADSYEYSEDTTSTHVTDTAEVTEDFIDESDWD